jgi:NAD(P)H-hydrate epimerase
MQLTREQARALDRRLIEEIGIPGLVLMENAGRGMAELLISLGIQGPVIVCCGKGNNGGDGLVMARHLACAGMEVEIRLFAEPAELMGDAVVNWRIVERLAIPCVIEVGAGFDDGRLRDELSTADWVVDALFGSGLTGPVRPPFDRVITAINGSRAKVLAVDVPSGFDADAGQPLGATVRADHTAVVLSPRLGFDQPGAAAWTGRVHVIALGTPPG